MGRLVAFVAQDELSATLGAPADTEPVGAGPRHLCMDEAQGLRFSCVQVAAAP